MDESEQANMDMDIKSWPRVLIISNNPLSDRSNNGKTIATIFSGYEPSRLRQLYFSSEEPTVPLDSYYRISDLDVLKRNIGKQANDGLLTVSKNASKSSVTVSQTSVFGRSVMLRLLREIMWIGHWRSDTLDGWLESSPPQVLFFVAGDSIFAYRIFRYIARRFKCKTIVYATDDYCLPQIRISPFFWIRCAMIKSAMTSSVRNCNLFLTISSTMRQTYGQVFGKDSSIIRNTVSVARSTIHLNAQDKAGVVCFVYAGGLHYNRWKTLIKLANAISAYNTEGTPKAILRVFCAQDVSNHIIKRLNVSGASEYGGALSSEELSTVHTKADVLVHAEAFDYRSRTATRLSLSTKIPEYLAMGKCILAIGPSEVASMKYLSGYSVCVNKFSALDKRLISSLVDPVFRQAYSNKAAIRLKTLEYGEINRQELQDLIVSWIEY